MRSFNTSKNVRNNAKKYWQDRHRKYGMTIYGVGNKGLSEEGNAKEYDHRKKTFNQICSSLNYDFNDLNVLELGVSGQGTVQQLLKLKDEFP